MVDGRQGSADLHLHTRASDGSQTVAALLDYVENHTDLDVIAITDHDDAAAGVQAREAAARRGQRVQVIPGVEISTRQGHLLGLDVEERPPPGRSYLHSAEWVVRRGGLCIAAHPFSCLTRSVSWATLAEAVAAGLIAGVETWNPSPAGRVSRTVAEVGASDAHWPEIVGMARTRFAGTTVEDLKAALLGRTTRAEGRFASPGELAVQALPHAIRCAAYRLRRRVASCE